MSANPLPHSKPAMANNTTEHAALLSPPQPETQESFQVAMDIPRPCTPSPSAPKVQDQSNAKVKSEPAQLETPESPLRDDFGKSPAAAARPTSSHGTGLKDPPLFELHATAPATERPLFSSFDQSSFDQSTSTPAHSTQSTAVTHVAPESKTPAWAPTALDAPPAPKSPDQVLPDPLLAPLHVWESYLRDKRGLTGLKRLFSDCLREEEEEEVVVVEAAAPRARPHRVINIPPPKRLYWDALRKEVEAATPRGRLFRVKNIPASKRPRVESDPLPRPPEFAGFHMPHPKAPLKPTRFRKSSTAIPPEQLDLPRTPTPEIQADLPLKSIEPVLPPTSVHLPSVPVARKRQSAPKAPRTQPQPEKEDKDNNPHWSAIRDYAPPLSSLDDDRVILEPLNWRGKTRKSFADHEARPHLHAKELVLCEKLAFCPLKYLRSKRQIFEKFVDFQRENHFRKTFNKTAAQGATNIDVTIASALHEAFSKAGWFDQHWFEKYMA